MEAVLLIAAVALPIAAAPPLLLLRGRGPAAGVVATAVAAASFTILLYLALRPGTPALAVPWIASLGVSFALRLDGLAAVFGLLASGVGAVIAAYAVRYLPHDLEHRGIARGGQAFFALFLLFLGSMLGLSVAADLVTLYVFFELTGVASFLLIGFDGTRERFRDAALQALAVTGTGGVLLLAGLLALVLAAGDAALPGPGGDAAARLAASGLAPLVLGTVVVAAMAKSAQVPLHFWLPAAMVAPTPVSAYLHSATLVAAGVFLLLRLFPALAPLPGFEATLAVVGTATMLVGGAVALVRTRLKEVLAYSTVSQYGYVFLLLGLDEPGSALYFTAVHAILKAGLFLVAGTISFETGRDDLRALGGLGRRRPLLAAITFLLALGLAGLPPLAGYWMKELTLEAAWSTSPWIGAASTVASILTLGYLGRFFTASFLGRAPDDLALPPRREAAPLVAACGLLAATGLLAGLFPGSTARITDVGLDAIAPGRAPTEPHLAWPPSPITWLSLGVLVAGVVLLAWIERRAAAPPAADRPSAASIAAGVARSLGAGSLWAASLRGLDGLSAFLVRSQSGKLRHYLLPLALAPLAAALPLLVAPPGLPETPVHLEDTAPALVPLALAAIALAVASTRTHSHLSAVLLVGGVGYLLAALFAVFRAPDVALVQVAVETVTALFLVLVLSRIPADRRRKVLGPVGTSGSRAVAALAGGAAGVGVAAALLAARTSGAESGIGAAYLAAAAEEGVEDVVTTILVDFRGLDTLGEIAVFAVAAIGAGLLLVRHRPPEPASEAGPGGRFDVLRATTVAIYPLMLLLAGSYLLNAHVLPGEGFSAGLLVAISVLLLYAAVGRAEVERMLPRFTRALLPAGLVLATVAAAVGLLAGRGLLANLSTHVPLGSERIPLSLATAFDLSILLIVAGGTRELFRLLGERREEER